MRRYAPLLTLLAVVVLGGALLALNLFGDPGNENGTPSAAPGGPTTVAAAPPSAAQPTAPQQAAPTTAPATATPAPTAAGQAPPVVAEKAYTGRSPGKEVTVAIAVKNGRAVGYICDGKNVEAWLEGTLSGSNLSLKSADGKSTIVGTVDAAQSSGTVAVAGKQWPYTAKASPAPAGLYEGRASVRGVLNRIGWIVLPDGTQTGLLENGSGTAVPPALDPAHPDAVMVDGVPVTVRTIGGGDVVIGS